MECESLEQYLKAFDVSLSVMQQPDAIRRIVVEACTDAVDDGVRYLELRFAPMLHTDGGLSAQGIAYEAAQVCTASAPPRPAQG